MMNVLAVRGSQGRLNLREMGHLWCVYNVQIHWLLSFVFQESQNVMQGAHGFVMRDSRIYVAQNVCPVTTALMA